jgi:hypothetical protein
LVDAATVSLFLSSDFSIHFRSSYKYGNFLKLIAFLEIDSWIGSWDGPQSRFERDGEKKNSLLWPCWKLNPGRPARS